MKESPRGSSRASPDESVDKTCDSRAEVPGIESHHPYIVKKKINGNKKFKKQAERAKG